MTEYGLSLTLFTEDSSNVGTHTVYLWCELDDYSGVSGYAEI